MMQRLSIGTNNIGLRHHVNMYFLYHKKMKEFINVFVVLYACLWMTTQIFDDNICDIIPMGLFTSFL